VDNLKNRAGFGITPALARLLRVWDAGAATIGLTGELRS
jgi:hypothetical protein